MRGSTFCGINMEAETACQDVRKILNKLQELHNGFGSETVAYYIYTCIYVFSYFNVFIG